MRDHPARESEGGEQYMSDVTKDSPVGAMKRWWWYPPGQWSGLLPSRGSDEYGRHTYVIPTLLAGTLVVPYKACDCNDMADFRCATDGCPWMAMVAGERCGVCDPWDEDRCHCGEPVAYGFDGDATHHRGMCDHCDLVRCDAYPSECRR